MQPYRAWSNSPPGLPPASTEPPPQSVLPWWRRFSGVMAQKGDGDKNARVQAPRQPAMGYTPQQQAHSQPRKLQPPDPRFLQGQGQLGSRGRQQPGQRGVPMPGYPQYGRMQNGLGQRMGPRAQMQANPWGHQMYQGRFSQPRGQQPPLLYRPMPQQPPYHVPAGMIQNRPGQARRRPTPWY